jgi:hypothetical protein
MKMKNACQRPVIIVANPITREVISYDIKISSVISEISWIVL